MLDRGKVTQCCKFGSLEKNIDEPMWHAFSGYTGHSFNDWNHCDLTAMVGSISSAENEGRVVGIAQKNQLGPGISIASLPELGADH